MNGYLTFKDSPKTESYLYHNHISLNSHLCTNHSQILFFLLFDKGVSSASLLLSSDVMSFRY